MRKFKRYERYKDSGVEWIGEIPEHWDVGKLKFVSSLLKGKNPEELTEDKKENLLPYLSMEYLRNNGDVLTFYAYPGRNLVIVNNGDILILWDGSNAGEIMEGKNGILSSTMAKIIPNKIIRRYLYWFLKGNEQIFKSNNIGMGIPHVNGEMLKNHFIFLPNLQEQKAIANFLDQKTAEIDGLIADKEKMIELLQEKRQAIITEAVTKGLNPNVRMKDSGIEWIGEIPEHWEVKKIKYLVKTIQTGITPATTNEDYFDGGIQWFTPVDFLGNKELYESKRKVSNRAVIDNEARLFPKDTVMIVGIGATVGKVAKLGVDGSFNQQITGLIVNDQILNSDYLYYWLYLNQETIKNISNYTTLPIVNNEFVKNFECLSLPLYEQQKIANYLDQKTNEIDDLIYEIKTQIQKLKEYRQSLISEAVTGKIDVRNYADN